VSGCVDHSNVDARHGNSLIVGERGIVHRWVCLLPQHLVVRMQENGRVESLAELRRHGDVVVVRMRAEHRDDGAITDGVDDRLRSVRGIDDEHLRVVADEPDVVVDVPAAAVETELPRRDDAVDAQAHSTTTERSTSPRCMVSNAASTWSNLMRSLTNFSSGRRPCWYRSTSAGKSRSDRQSPYHDDFSAPPRENKSTSGISSVMSGVGTHKELAQRG
jgi:hypothetical protein